MSLTLKIIERKNNWLAYLSHINVFIIFLFIVFPISILMMLFLEDNATLVYILGLLSIVFLVILKTISLNRYRIIGQKDYNIVGHLTLNDQTVQINEDIINLKSEGVSIKIIYAGIRSLGNKNKDVSNGLSKIEIGEQKLEVLITSTSQVNELKKLLSSWYENNISVDETEKESGFRLIKLNSKWEWSELEKINRA